jgi:molecular chaperone DnaJ
MNLQEARSILEIPDTATPEEAKKKYRDLAKRLHPDVNKEPGAEDRFKKINEAYQVISTGKSSDREDVYSNANPFAGFGGFGSHAQQIRYHHAENINLNTTISFKESILGCKKDLKFNRTIKCINCNGNGHSQVSNGCVTCGGKGHVTNRQGNMIFSRTCDKCHGVTKTMPCTSCETKGTVSVEVSINVTIPGGIQNTNILRLSGMGHFVCNMGPYDQCTDAHLHVQVTPQLGLKLDGNNVICNLEITLLEALSGTNKKIDTIMGEREIEIKPQSRNKDEVIISHLGVNGVGDQKVILDVKYPENINALINVLSNKEI